MSLIDRVCVCVCQVVIEAEPATVAVAHIMLDQNIPAGLWLNLVTLKDCDLATDYTSAQWVHARNLPAAVETCAFPAWAGSFVFSKGTDIVADFLDSSRLIISPWSTAMSKASLVQEEEEEEEPKMKKKKTTKQQSARRRGKKTGNPKNKPAKKRNRELVNSEDTKDQDTKMAALLAQSQAQEAKITAELEVFRRQAERDALKKGWQAERKPDDDNLAIELTELRRNAMAAEIRKEVKSEFKAKKAKLQQKVENVEDSSSIAQEKLLASHTDRIKDLLATNTASNQRREDYEANRQQLQGPDGHWQQQQGPGSNWQRQQLQCPSGQWQQQQGPSGQGQQLEGPANFGSSSKVQVSGSSSKGQVVIGSGSNSKGQAVSGSRSKGQTKIGSNSKGQTARGTSSKGQAMASGSKGETSSSDSSRNCKGQAGGSSKGQPSGSSSRMSMVTTTMVHHTQVG